MPDDQRYDTATGRLLALLVADLVLLAVAVFIVMPRWVALVEWQQVIWLVILGGSIVTLHWWLWRIWRSS